MSLTYLFSQNPFNQFTVIAIGDDSATSLFTLDGTTVRVTSAANLQADSGELYKVTHL